MLKGFNECVCVWLWDWMSTPQEYGALPLSQSALCVGTLPLNQHAYPSLVEALFGLLSFCLFHFLSGSSLCSWPEGRPKTPKRLGERGSAREEQIHVWYSGYALGLTWHASKWDYCVNNWPCSWSKSVNVLIVNTMTCAGLTEDSKLFNCMLANRKRKEKKS